MDFAKEIERAKAAISGYEAGRQFTLRSLFPKEEWEAMDRSRRQYFGRVFSNEVKASNIPGVG